MKIITSIEEMRNYSTDLKSQNLSISSVDTDGRLHEGHMALVKIAKEKSDIVVVNVGHTTVHSSDEGSLSLPHTLVSTKRYNEYVEIYEQDQLFSDIDICKKYGVDVFFYPSMDKLHLKDNSAIPLKLCELYKTKVISQSTSHMNFVYNLDIEGLIYIHTLKSFFSIFDVVYPDISIVGQKDIFQCLALKSIIEILKLPISVFIAPIIRENNGFAYSSRNDLLSESGRQNAASIYKTLIEVSNWNSYPSVDIIKAHITSRILNAFGRINYINICCVKTFESLNIIDREAVIVINAVFEDWTFWDNIIIKPKKIV